MNNIQRAEQIIQTSHGMELFNAIPSLISALKEIDSRLQALEQPAPKPAPKPAADAPKPAAAVKS